MASRVRHLAVDRADDGCAQAHAGQVADVPVVVEDDGAHAWDEEEADDEDIAVPLVQVGSPDERYEGAAYDRRHRRWRRAATDRL